MKTSSRQHPPPRRPKTPKTPKRSQARRLARVRSTRRARYRSPWPRCAVRRAARLPPLPKRGLKTGTRPQPSRSGPHPRDGATSAAPPASCPRAAKTPKTQARGGEAPTGRTSWGASCRWRLQRGNLAHFDPGITRAGWPCGRLRAWHPALIGRAATPRRLAISERAKARSARRRPSCF